MGTIKDLLNLDGRVYVFVPNENARRIFLKNAEAEGFRFGDGKRPTKRKAYDDIYALNKDLTINFVGFFGHMWFNHPSASQSKLIRIDYAAYLCNAEDYEIHD